MSSLCNTVTDNAANSDDDSTNSDIDNDSGTNSDYGSSDAESDYENESNEENYDSQEEEEEEEEPQQQEHHNHQQQQHHESITSTASTVPDLIKIKPYPNKKKPKTTSYLTHNQINHETFKPSLKWIEAGLDTGSDLGMVYLEILKCDDIPNLDSGTFGDYTDAFVAIVFEDNLVRTDVINDELSPRWLPWTQRAFAFPMKHPGKVLVQIYMYKFTCMNVDMIIYLLFV